MGTIIHSPSSQCSSRCHSSGEALAAAMPLGWLQRREGWSCSGHGEPNPGLSDFSVPLLGPVMFLHSFIPSTQTNVFNFKSVFKLHSGCKKMCLYI